MLKKTVNYEDFDGNQRTEVLHFNLTQTELVEMAMDLPDGMSETIGDDPNKVDQDAAARKLIEKLGGKGIFEFIKTLLLKSYGIKSEDGRRIVKSKEISEEFSQTLAFDIILMELMSDDVKAAEFVNGIIPANVVGKMAASGNKPVALPVK